MRKTVNKSKRYNYLNYLNFHCFSLICLGIFKKKNIKSCIIFGLKILIVGHSQEKIETCLLLLKGNRVYLVFFMLWMIWSSMSRKLAQATGGSSFLTGLWAGPIGLANVSLQIGLDDLMKNKQLCLNDYLTLGYIWANNKADERLQNPNERTWYSATKIRKRIQEKKRHKSKVDDLALFFRRRLLTSPSLLLNLAGDWENLPKLRKTISDWDQ